MTEHRITDAEYAAALAAGRTEAECEIRAQAVRYVPDRDVIEIVTTRNAGFLVPRQWIRRASGRVNGRSRKAGDLAGRIGDRDRRS
jgi:hypothetical protein